MTFSFTKLQLLLIALVVTTVAGGSHQSSLLNLIISIQSPHHLSLHFMSCAPLPQLSFGSMTKKSILIYNHNGRNDQQWPISFRRNHAINSQTSTNLSQTPVVSQHHNTIADSLSCFSSQKFRVLAPESHIQI